MHFDYPDQSESQKRIQASVDGILPVLKKSSKKTAKRTIAKKYTVWCQNENGEVYSEIMSGDSAGDAKKRAENKGKNVIDVEEYSAPLAAGKKAAKRTASKRVGAMDIEKFKQNYIEELQDDTWGFIDDDLKGNQDEDDPLLVIENGQGGYLREIRLSDAVTMVQNVQNEDDIKKIYDFFAWDSALNLEDFINQTLRVEGDEEEPFSDVLKSSKRKSFKRTASIVKQPFDVRPTSWHVDSEATGGIHLVKTEEE